MLTFKGRTIEGYIVHTRCSNCSCEAYNFIFSGDTDMATSGLVAVTRPGSAGIAITEAMAKEWNDYDTAAISRRVNAALGTTGFIYLDYGHFKNKENENEWLPVCPQCRAAHYKVHTLTLSDFAAQGGAIYKVDRDNVIK